MFAAFMASRIHVRANEEGADDPERPAGGQARPRKQSGLREREFTKDIVSPGHPPPVQKLLGLPCSNASSVPAG